MLNKETVQNIKIFQAIKAADDQAKKNRYTYDDNLIKVSGVCM